MIPGNGTPFLSQALPAFVQYVNSGTVPGSNFMQLKVAGIAIDQIDSNIGKPYPYIQAGKGLSAYQGWPGGTVGSTSNYTNSLAAGAGNALGKWR